MYLSVFTAPSTRPLPHFDADLGQLARIRDFVTATAATHGVAERALDDLRLAVDEAITNILVHGYQGGGGIDIEVAPHGRDLVIQLRDQAPPFDPVNAMPESLEPLERQKQPGGFGLFLMQKAMDEISYRRVGSSNELTLTKRNVIGPG